MADFELLQDISVGTKPKESKETEGGEVDHSAVAKAVEHGRADTLGKSGAMHLQRMAGNAAMGALVQRKASGEQDQEGGGSPVHDVVGKGGGSSLDAGVRTQMEAGLGHDFSDVKVHTGPDAANASKSVQAQAFTVGNEIVFNEGKYNPTSPEGQRTIAHELTHVVQQREGAVDGTPRAGGISVSDPGDKYEQEAESTADAVMSGGHEGHDHGAGGGGESAGVQREAEDNAPLQTLRDDTAVQRAPDEDDGPAVDDEPPTAQALHDDTAVQRNEDSEEE
ncbi:MAG TPA: DUF4157 domain-containing protein [Acidimicrobiales bacterium]|nr:DUF4157 domain-containing protein [Acidimicrobiales bacterium]